MQMLPNIQILGTKNRSDTRQGVVAVARSVIWIGAGKSTYSLSFVAFSIISSICLGVTTYGFIGKCLIFPVTRYASSSFLACIVTS